jgi:hypothetical protein
MVRVTWQWLAAKPVRPLLTLWTEAYARSLAEPGGPWSGVARQTVEDWLALLAAAQPTGRRSGTAISAEHTLALAVLRGRLLDLLATGDTDRVTAAIQHYLRLTLMDGKGDDATPPTLPDATGDGGTVLGRVMWVDLRPVEISEAGAQQGVGGDGRGGAGQQAPERPRAVVGHLHDDRGRSGQGLAHGGGERAWSPT